MSEDTKRIGDPNDGQRRANCPFLATGESVVMVTRKLEKLGSLYLPDPGYVPDTGEKKKNSLDRRFEVVAIGPDVQHATLGQSVIPHPGCTFNFPLNGTQYFICDEDAIIAIVCEENVPA
jgi:hypothetical protein